MLHTCYGGDGALDRRAQEQPVEACLAAGVQGLALLGIVGQYHKLDVREKLQFVEWTMEASRGRLPVAVTVGEPSQPARPSAADLEACAALRHVLPEITWRAVDAPRPRESSGQAAPARRARGGRGAHGLQCPLRPEDLLGTWRCSSPRSRRPGRPARAWPGWRTGSRRPRAPRGLEARSDAGLGIDVDADALHRFVVG